MSALLDAALEYAHRGWRVFPLHGIVNGVCTCGRTECSSAGKHPLVRKGLYEATTDMDKIRSWWKRWWSANIGIATGFESGIAVVDIDLPLAFSSFDRLIGELPVTLTALTGGGGLHLIYRCSDSALGNAAGRLPGIDEELPGIDLRANGGYVVAAPSVHRSGGQYEWAWPARSLVPTPDWLKQAERASVDVAGAKPVELEGDGTPYGLRVLADEVLRLRGAQVGTRNHELNRCTFVLAQLVAGSELQESLVRSSLLETGLSIGLAEPEVRQTIDSAFEAGLRSPRVAPHRLKG